MKIISVNVRPVRQADNWSCGPCCIEALTGQRPKIGKPVVGTSWQQMVAALRRRGYPVTTGDGWTVEDLRYHTDRGRGVICLTTAPCGAGHWVVVWKATTRRVYVHDPNEGPRVYSPRGFVSLWSSEGWNQVGIAVTTTA